MQNNIKIAVIGGTGKSGKYLVQQLSSQGYFIKMLVRNPEGIQPITPLTEIIPGNARNYEDICTLIDGCEAVISTLGQAKEETPIFSQATTNIIRAMQKSGIRRYILTTGLNVDTPFDKKSEKTAFATEWMKTNYGPTTLDKQKEYEILSETDLDWTMVRLPLIELTDKKSNLKISLEDCPGEKISSSNLADFLIDQLLASDYIRQAPFVANG